MLADCLGLEDFTEGELRVSHNVAASTLTTFRLGGTVSEFLEPQTPEVLLELLMRAQRHQTSWRILGAGSNLLFASERLSDILLRLGRGFSGWGLLESELCREDILRNTIPYIDVEDRDRREASTREMGSPVRIYAYGATSLMSLSRQLSALGLSGLEFAAGIPASVGGAVAMNAGAHGSELANVLRSITVVTAEHGLQILPASTLAICYRRIRLPMHSVVVGAEFELTQNEPNVVKERRAEALAYRKATQPLHLPSAGSVFKNPSSDTAAAQLLEQVDIKGFRHGGVEFSAMHSNWLVKMTDQATAGNVLSLVHEAQSRVEARFGVQLEREIICW